MADNSAGLGLRVRFVFGLGLTLSIATLVAVLRCTYYALTFRWKLPCKDCGDTSLSHFFNGVVHAYVSMFMRGFIHGALQADVPSREVKIVTSHVSAVLVQFNVHSEKKS